LIQVAIFTFSSLKIKIFSGDNHGSSVIASFARVSPASCSCHNTQSAVFALQNPIEPFKRDEEREREREFDF
jgi:hypothetical protein